MTMRHFNFLVAAILGGLLLLFYLVLDEVPPPSNIYPLTMIYLLGFLVLVLLAVNLFKPGPSSTIKPFADTKKLRVAGIAVASVVYVVCIPLLGFYVASTIILFFFNWVLGGLSTKPKDVLTYAGVSLIVMIIVYLGFSLFLKVPTPRGIFF